MGATLNGADAVSCEIVRARVGAWHADLVVNAKAAPTGAATIVASGVTFRGFVARGAMYGGRARVRVIGGAGGLSKTVPALGYRNVRARVATDDVLRVAGESLASSSSAAALDTSLPFWSRASGTVSRALSQIADRCAAVWRVLPDGSVWFGRETWPTSSVKYELIHEDPIERFAELATEAPTLAPGTVLDGRRVIAVTHYLDADKSRDHVWYE